MPEPIKINTGKYINQGQVEIDGKLWSISLPGAGTELRFSQASRASKLYGARIAILDKKIDAGTITEQELNQYEEYSAKYEENEQIIYNVFQSTFKDGTDDNADVIKWIDETPTAIIIMAFEDVKNAASSKVIDKATNESTGSSESA